MEQSPVMTVALQVLVVVMMVAIGLELRPSELAGGLRGTPWLVAAVVLNVGIVPIGVWLVADQSSLSEGMVTGLVLLAASPAGPIGPMLARLSHSDIGFATGLMVLLGVIGLLSTPVTVVLLVEVDAESTTALAVPMFIALLVSQIAPLFAAMYLGHRFPDVAQRMAKPIGRLANVLLVGIVVALVFLRGELLTNTPLSVHVALIAGLFSLLGPVLVLAQPESILRSLVTVTAVRNMSVALFLASRFFDSEQVEAAILIWSFWMLVVPAVVGGIAGRFRTAQALLADGFAAAEVEEVEAT